MSNNIKILDGWYESFKDFEKLSFKEAQNLSLQFKNEKEIAKKKRLKDKLVLGTMHFLYKELKTSFILNFQALGNDVYDVIQAASEIWIQYVLSDKILTSHYSNYFQSTFYSKLNTSMYGDSFFCYDIFEIYIFTMLSNFKIYLHDRRNNSSFSYEDFERIICTQNTFLVYYCFEELYSLLEEKELLDQFDDVTISQMKALFLVLLHAYLEPTYNPKDKTSKILCLSTDKQLNEVERQFLRERVRELFLEISVFSLRSKILLAESCGLSWEQDSFGNSHFVEKKPKTFKQMALEKHLEKARIKNLIQRSCRLIQKDLIRSCELMDIQEELVRTREWRK